MRMAWGDFLSLLAVLVIAVEKKSVTGRKCDVPYTAAARANQSPLSFSISEIKSEPSWVFSSVAIEDYIYTVQHCYLLLYVLSKETRYNDLLKGQKLSGKVLGCRSLDDSQIEVMGKILRYFDDKEQKPDVVPADWYEGGRMVLQIVFFKFPHKPMLKIRCGVKPSGVTDIEIFADATISSIGCPKSKWGTSCQDECPCKNGGVCHTFEGTCSCPDGYDGVHCEIYYWSTMKPKVVSNVTETTTIPPPDIAEEEENEAENKPKEGGVESAIEDYLANSSSHLAFGFPLQPFYFILVLCTVLLSR